MCFEYDCIMKFIYSRIILISADLITIYISIILALYTRIVLQGYFELPPPQDYKLYLQFFLLYGISLLSLCFFGIYSNRFDFWQELQRILKGLFLSIIIIFFVLAMTKQNDDYSRFIIVISFLIAMLFLPLQKYLLKNLLFKIGWWRKEAKLIGKDPFFSKHVFQNHYLGYVPAKQKNAKTLFIASSHNHDQIEMILHQALIAKQEVIFIPIVKNYDFSDAKIIHLFNARSNLIIVQNNLLSRSNQWMKMVIDYTLSVMILPILLIVIAVIALLIKREEANGNVFFKQTRMGKDSKEFACYKFRSMREDGTALLTQYLNEHPEEVKNYEIYHKYENDPRITRVGAFLRKTSLDELPQIFNVLKGEMSLIGPRPYMPNERSKIGENVDIILKVKPGITGLWQVSGRNDIDFMSRVDLDVWYVRNWSVWNDIIILIKTVQVVLGKKGAS